MTSKRGAAPSSADNLVSLAYKIGQDHGEHGVFAPEVVAEHLRDIYENGRARASWRRPIKGDA